MITIVTDDSTFSLDVDPDAITLESLRAVFEADSGIQASQQLLTFNGGPLAGEQKTLRELGIADGDLIMCSRSPTSQTSAPSSSSSATVPAATSAAAAASNQPGAPRAAAQETTQRAPSISDEQQANAIREQLLSNPQLLAQLNATNPELASTLLRNPIEAVSMLRQLSSAAASGAAGDFGDEEIDEYSPEAQRRIEEAIRQQAIYENLESAMEYNPESFGRVTMLYVDAVVNGEKVKAFVDSGAQATIMSPDCAERCGLMRLLDTRFAGIARGVGTAKILGRIHSAQIKLGDELFLPCSFTIMEGRGVELLFGLDMLKRFQATIDLKNNCLVIDEKRVRFLDEHELPESARMEEMADEVPGAPGGGAGAAGAGTTSETTGGTGTAGAAGGGGFPGSGRTLGTSSGGGPGAPATSGMSWEHGRPGAAAGAAGGGGTAGAASSTTGAAAPSGGGATSDAARAAPIRSPAQGGAQPLAAPPAAVAGAAAATPRSQPQRPPSSHPPESVRALTDLGATEAQAVQLLDSTAGDVDAAASLLFS